MFLELVNDTSEKYYAQPAMVLNVVNPENNDQNFSDEDIFKTFCSIPDLKAIIIAGPEPMNKLDDLRAFIFSARKFFSPYARPLIIVYTDYFEDELEGRNWLGVKCEFLLYGNVLLKYGRSFPTDYRMYKNRPLGIKLLGKSQEVYSYRGLQHE